jgi:hypothetical protein
MVLEADARGPQATTEGVLEIVDPNVRQTSSRARPFPPRLHALRRLLVRQENLEKTPLNQRRETQIVTCHLE